MPLISLEIRNVRVYEHAQIHPDPNLNLIIGANASGKTSLLEAIHLLGTGRSYRTSDLEQIQKQNTLGLSVQGGLAIDLGAQASTAEVSFSRSSERRRITINGLAQTQVSAIAQLLPLQVISPDTHYEFRGSSRHRRGVLDWVLFHVEPEFQDIFGRYQRILQQRNAGLKASAQSRARHVWDESLAVLGEEIHAMRMRVLAGLKADFMACCRDLLGPEQEVDLFLESGWQQGKNLRQCLADDAARDGARGFTHSGPHRADLSINLYHLAKPIDASHGQYKLLVMALRLAQIRFFAESKNKRCCLLIDDLAAELDTEHRARLVKLLSSLPVQLFVTATESSSIDIHDWPSYKAFHVEQGSIKEGGYTRIYRAAAP